MTEGEIARVTDTVLDILAVLAPLPLEEYGPIVLTAAKARGMSEGEASLFAQIIGVLANAQAQLRGLTIHAALYRSARE